jgi:predicted enzyme related to lactoylglutathione lyase
MKSIVHFEIPFDDKERAIKFYSELFDWKIDEMPEIGYIGATTSPTGDDMILKEPGAINGALVPRTNDQPNIVVTINVDSNNFYQPELAVRGILGTDILEANLNFKHVPFLKLYVCEHIVPRMGTL